MKIDPWNIIGWIALSGIAAIFAFILIPFIQMEMARVGHRIRSRKHRRTEPERGQTWSDSEFRYYHIQRVDPDGGVVFKFNTSYWKDSPEEWKHRVATFPLTLIENTTSRSDG